MAPGAAVATSLAVGAVYAGGALPLSVLLTLAAALVIAIERAARVAGVRHRRADAADRRHRGAARPRIRAATAFQLLATILPAVMIGIYIVINLSSIGYYWRKQRSEFNWLLHLVLPGVGALVLIPVLAAATGVGSSVLKFVTPLPYPISEAGLAVGIWYLLGIGYLAYLLRRHPEQLRDMGKVFD